MTDKPHRPATMVPLQAVARVREGGILAMPRKPRPSTRLQFDHRRLAELIKSH